MHYRRKYIFLIFGNGTMACILNVTLPAEGEVVAGLYHLSLSDLAASRKTHFLSRCTQKMA